MAELHLLSPRGFIANGIYAGIKIRQTPDVGLLIAESAASAAAAFTTNRVFAAPVKVGREHVAKGALRGIVINSGNANACTGKQGERDARRMCELAAAVAKCKAAEILPSSTGIIGHLLPMEKVERGIIEAGQNLGSSAEHALAFGDAILTTDTKRKTAAAQFKIGKQTVTLAGICKGAGMIGPRVAVGAKAKQATMLAYLTTDAQVAPTVLRKLLQDASDGSFNAVTIDDHMSTNDTAVILASGASGAKIAGPKAVKTFAAALAEVTQSLAYQIAADGEGATKVVTVTITGAKTPADARLMARAVANSPLVKCAMHGNDPNWGRIVSAAGLAGAAFDPDKATLTLQGTVVFDKGTPTVIDAAAVSNALKEKEVKVDLNCRLGKASATVWTCDLSKEYVTINADYHT
ncbi:MAG TPA: bifunctional glutamate N-acetyltransferase/amino-acid acetyltransferase ArgJ [Tepidisphaeraceae bacterium]|nr:bifunctional glutamate N-acetyltransferase/amino-acid acetyltransferase ArgJ [Tepidisphaeraceae bacterium]